MSLAITIRQIDDVTGTWLQQESRRRGVKIEEMALALIRKGMQAERAALPEYHDLDALAGTWSEEDAKEFLKNTADFEKIDIERYEYSCQTP